MSAVVLGHRGGRGEGWPAENTVEAFERALREGAAGVELDVRLCATGEVVLHHDAHLADGRAIARLSRRDLPMLASLDEALEACRGRVVNVEIKADVPHRRRLVAEVARIVARASSVDVLVSSFDPFVVAASAAAAPRVRRGILVGKRTPRLALALPYAMRAAVSCANLEDPLYTADRVRRLSRLGLGLVAWTVNDEARARELVAMGVTTIITDRPGAIVDALARISPRT